jgi:hypothetical protein
LQPLGQEPSTWLHGSSLAQCPHVDSQFSPYLPLSQAETHTNIHTFTYTCTQQYNYKTRKHHYDAREPNKIYHKYRLTAILFYKLLPKIVERVRCVIHLVFSVAKCNHSVDYFSWLGRVSLSSLSLSVPRCWHVIPVPQFSDFPHYYFIITL